MSLASMAQRRIRSLTYQRLPLLFLILFCVTLGLTLVYVLSMFTPPFSKPDIIPCDPDSSSCSTLVTSYFVLTKSKHTVAEYTGWIRNFLPKATAPLVIFTQPSLQPMLAKLREGKPTHFILYEEEWDLPPVSERKCLFKQYYEMHAIDPAKGLHSPELYAVWNSKPWMMQEVAELNPFNSTYFFWFDIGSVRTGDMTLGGFPNVTRAIQVFGRDESSQNFQKLNVFALRKFENYKSPPGNNTFEEMAHIDFIIGGFLGGTRPSLTWFSEQYYALHDSKLSQGVFVGVEQTLYNWIVTQKPDRFLVVCACLQTPWECGDQWFYFQYWWGYRNPNCASSPVRNMVDYLNEYKNM